MRRVIGFVVLAVLFGSPLTVEAIDNTNVFRVRLLPENEVPAVSLTGASADATITVRVTRDERGSIDEATVTFELDYAMPQTTTFTGLHIHNAPIGTSGSVVIDSGLRPSDFVTGTSGRITRTVDFKSLDSEQLRSVEGLLAAPHLYYVNLHSTDVPSGVIRAQLRPNVITFGPALLPENEVPAIVGLDARGAAKITVQVHRDKVGSITSGIVTFEVDYRFAGSITVTGLHVHNAAAGISGPVVINSGVNSTGPIVDGDGQGSIFRVVTISPTDNDGLATLNALISNPDQFYVNLHTADSPSGAIRGQLDRNSLSFLTGLTGDEGVPAVTTTGTAQGLITATVTRNGAGNIDTGSVAFGLDYSFPGSATFTGLHIHNSPIGAAGPVRVNSGIGGADTIVDDDGVGTINRQATIDAGNTVGVEALNGLFVAPERYYVNLHTASNPAGIVRAQLGYETYHFSNSLSPMSEAPPVVSTATGTAWMTVLVKRDGNGTITSGSVNFDVDFTIGETTTLTGLHIHNANAGINGPVVVNSGVTSVVSDSGTGNVFRKVDVPPTDSGGLQALAGIVDAATGYYVNLHTTLNPAGMMRGQLLQSSSFIPQTTGGGGWITSVTISNPSSTRSVEGIVKFFEIAGTPFPENLIDPTIPVWIPPSGSVTLNTHNQGMLTNGFARIDSDGEVTTQVSYMNPNFTSSGVNVPTTTRSATAEISIGNGQRTAVAVLGVEGGHVVFTVRDRLGAIVGSAAVDLGHLEHYAGFIDELIPGLAGSTFEGTLGIQSSRSPFRAGLMSIVMVDYGPDSARPVAVNPENAEARLLTLQDIQKMGGTDFDGGVGDYLLRNDQIEAVILAIGASPDFNIPYTAGNLPSRGVLIDVGTRGDRNDQFDELHQALNMEFTAPGVSGGPDPEFDQNLVEYFGDPVFHNDGITASITVFGQASLNYGGIVSPPLPVTTTYKLNYGSSWVDIETEVINNTSTELPAFTITDIDVMVAKGRLAFQPFPGLGAKPSGFPFLRVWDFIVLPGTNGPEDGPSNNDGTPAGEACYGYMSVNPKGPMVGWAIRQAGATSRFFDLDTLNSSNVNAVPTLAVGESLAYQRRLVVAPNNTVDACLRIMIDDIYPNGNATFAGRIVDGLGNPVPEVHIFFDNTMPGSPAYPAVLETAEGSRLPVNHTVTGADGRFEVVLPALADPAITPSVYLASVRAPERETLDIGPFTVDAASVAGGPVALGDFTVTDTGTLDFKVLRLLSTGQRMETPVKLGVYGTNGTANPDFGSQYVSLRDFPGKDPLQGASSDFLSETFGNTPALNITVDADGEGRLELKPGTYKVYASRGFEYTIDSAEITIDAGQTTLVELEISAVVRSTHVASMDAHIHGVKSFDASSPMNSRVLAFAAAGIEIMVGTDHDYVTDYSPIITDLNLGHEIRSITGMELSSRFPVPAGTGWTADAFPSGIAHWGAWPVPVIPGARRNGAIQDEFITPGTAIDRMRGLSSLPFLNADPGTATLDEWLGAIQAGQPGTPGESLPDHDHDEIVVLNHPRGTGTPGLFTVLAKDDAKPGYDPDLPITEYPNNLMKLPSLYNSVNVGSGGTATDGLSFDAMELINGWDMKSYLEVRRDWFSLLDQGIHKTGVANSDSHRVVLETPGMGRTYVFHNSEDSLTMEKQELIDNLRSMRAVGTTGPMIHFGVVGDAVDQPLDPYFNTIGGTVTATSDVVTLQIRVEAPPWIPVQEVRIFQNGCLARTLTLTSDVVLDKTLRFLSAVELDGLVGDTYLTVEAGMAYQEDGDSVKPELLETMQFIVPPLVDLKSGDYVNPVIAFTNPVFVDRQGDGYKAPGLRVGECVPPLTSN
jgi:hypothetical protein